MTDRKDSIEDIMKSFWRMRHRMFNQHHHEHREIYATPAQLQVLFLVKEKNGIGVTEIAKKLNVTSSAATQLVNELVECGFLTRETDTADRRVYRLSLTQKIKMHMAKMKNDRLKKMSGLFSNLSDDELATFSDLIRKIATEK